MQTTIVCLEQYAVHLLEQFGNRTYDLHAILLDSLREARNALIARLDGLRTMGIGCHDAEIRGPIGGRGAVDEFGKGGGMRGVQTDDADFYRLLGYGDGCHKEQCRKKENTQFHEVSRFFKVSSSVLMRLQHPNISKISLLCAKSRQDIFHK